MNTEPTRPAATSTGPQSNGPPADLRQEVEHLRETVQLLEAERHRGAERLRAVEEEREEYRKALERELAARVRTEIRPEGFVLPDPADCLSFDQFAHELDGIVKSAGSGTSK